MLSHLSSIPTFCDPTDCSPAGSSVHEILLARILEWVAISYSRGSSQVKNQTHVSRSSCTAGRFFTTEPLGNNDGKKRHRNSFSYHFHKKEKNECQIFGPLFPSPFSFGMVFRSCVYRNIVIQSNNRPATSKIVGQ